MEISVPEAEAFCELPMPPADPFILHEIPWNGTWQQFSKDIGQRKYAWKQTKPLSASHQRQVAREYLVTNNKDEALYRRVHVLPYQGDVIKGYIAAGDELRAMLVQYLYQNQVAKIGLDPLEAVVEEFEEMLEDGISPSSHVTIRRTRNLPSGQRPYNSPETFLETWFNYTGRMLLSVPFGSKIFRSRCQAIGKKLMEPANKSHAMINEPLRQAGHGIADLFAACSALGITDRDA